MAALSLIYARKGVSLRLDEDGDSVPGFLALSSYQSQYALTWLALDSITNNQVYLLISASNID
jgi:hypothetical protein